jgi:hypothetical protein
VQRVCEEYEQTGSTKKRNYQDISFNASYLLAIIKRFLRN